MAMQTGENEQAMRKILDMTRLISIVILVIHFYYYCYAAFQDWGLSSALSDRLLGNIYRIGLFGSFHKSKLIALGFLFISLLGARGRKNEKLNHKTAFAYIITGLLINFTSYLALLVKIKTTELAILYVGITSIGFLLSLSGGTLLSRIIRNRLNSKDIFNRENETFPQEERLLENEYSINLPARYQLKDKMRNSWINIINPFRGVMVLGTPGSGKSYFVIRHIITQVIRKDYGREQADVIMNITGNIISGQVTGDTAKQLSERFGKIMQDRESLSINASDTSISRSKQLESAVPPSKISGLSSGEFVGMVADDPDCKIDLKTFHCEILNDHEALKKEQEAYKDIQVIRKLDNTMVQRNYLQIKQDVQDIIQSEMERLLNNPGQVHLVVSEEAGR